MTTLRLERFLKVDPNDARDFYYSNSQVVGDTPGYRLEENGATRHLMGHDPTLGNEGSWVLRNADGENHIVVDHETGVATINAGFVAEQITVPVSNQTELEDALNTYDGSAVPVVMQMSSGSYNFNQLPNVSFTTLRFEGPSKESGYLQINGFGTSFATAANEITITGFDTSIGWSNLAVNDVLCLMRSDDGSYAEYTVTSLVSQSVFEVSPAPPGTWQTGDVLAIKADATITTTNANIPFELSDLLNESAFAFISFKNVHFVDAQFETALATIDVTFDECTGENWSTFFDGTGIAGLLFRRSAMFIGGQNAADGFVCSSTDMEAIRTAFIRSSVDNFNNPPQYKGNCAVNFNNCHFGSEEGSFSCELCTLNFSNCTFHANAATEAFLQLVGGTIYMKNYDFIQDGVREILHVIGACNVTLESVQTSSLTNTNGGANGALILAERGAKVSFVRNPNVTNLSGGRNLLYANSSSGISTDGGNAITVAGAGLISNYQADAVTGAGIPIVTGILGTGCYVS